MIKYFLEYIKFKTKMLLENYPSLYIRTAYKYNRSRYPSSTRVVSKTSIVCIEGYPRCANSYSRDAFVKYTGINSNIATHLHSAAQIKQAVKLSIPTIVTIRQPHKCIPSLRALTIQAANNDNVTPLLLPLKEYLIWYINFYDSLMGLSDGYIIAKFEDITTDFGIIIKKYNERYNTNYNTGLNKDIVKEEIFNKANFHLSPSKERDKIKEHFINEYKNSNLEELKRKAEKVYSAFIAQ